MTGALAVAVLAALPAGASQRYRVEIRGEPVGWASIAIACRPAACDAKWRSALRAPDGRGVVGRRLDVQTDRGGVAIRLRVGAAERAVPPAAAPSTLVEILLSAAADGDRLCLAAFEEESGETGAACARRRGAWLEGEVLGTRVRFRAGPGALPDEVEVLDQGVRFVADPAAALPAAAPRFLGVAVAGPARARGGRALRFCGMEADTPPAGVDPGLAFPRGESCREKTRRYLELAARRGIAGRHAIGVAHDGAAFVWHEWAELRLGGRWVAVDPSFRQAPAEGPRFTVARYAPGDTRARAAAGRRILECWGRAAVEER